MSERWHCLHHPDHFVTPCKQEHGRHTGCAKCTHGSQTSLEARIRRAKRWDSKFIPCVKSRHADRRCNRSQYVADGHRRCGSCKAHNSCGERTTSYQRGLNAKRLMWMERNRYRRDPFHSYRGLSKLDLVLSGISTNR